MDRRDTIVAENGSIWAQGSGGEAQDSVRKGEPGDGLLLASEARRIKKGDIGCAVTGDGAWSKEDWTVFPYDERRGCLDARRPTWLLCSQSIPDADFGEDIDWA